MHCISQNKCLHGCGIGFADQRCRAVQCRCGKEKEAAFENIMSAGDYNAACEEFWGPTGKNAKELAGWTGVMLAYSIRENKKGDTNKLIWYLEKHSVGKKVKPCGRADLWHALTGFNQGSRVDYVVALLRRVIALITWDSEQHKAWVGKHIIAACVEFYGNAFELTTGVRDESKSKLSQNLIDIFPTAYVRPIGLKARTGSAPPKEKKLYIIEGLDELRADKHVGLSILVYDSERPTLPVNADPDEGATNSLTKYAGQVCEGLLMKEGSKMMFSPLDRDHAFLAQFEPRYKGVKNKLRVDSIESRITVLRQIEASWGLLIRPQDSGTHKWSFGVGCLRRIKYKKLNEAADGKSPDDEQPSAALASLILFQGDINIHGILTDRETGRDPNIDMPIDPERNGKQQLAYAKAMIAEYTAIRGPPGTGKTRVAADIVAGWNKLRCSLDILNADAESILSDMHCTTGNSGNLKDIHVHPRVQILVSSQSNQVLENMMECLPTHNSDLVLLKVGKDAISDKIKAMQLDNMMVDKHGDRYWEWMDSNTQVQERDAILLTADVICITCSSAACPELSGFWFPCLLVDEAGLHRRTQIESLIPIMHGFRVMAVLGDDKQLAAIVNQDAKKLGFDISTFERICTESEKFRDELNGTSMCVDPWASGTSVYMRR